jgi:hypothetical protein
MKKLKIRVKSLVDKNSFIKYLLFNNQLLFLIEPFNSYGVPCNNL